MKAKRQKKMLHPNSNPQRAEVTLPVSEKIDNFKSKIVTGDKEDHLYWLELPRGTEAI